MEENNIDEMNINFSIFNSIKYVFIKNNDNKKMIKIKKESLKVTESSIKEFEEYKECKVLQNIKCILGCIEIFGIKHIIFVSKCEIVSNFIDKQIYFIKEIDFCLCDISNIPSKLKKDIDFIYKEIKEVIEQNFYFSYNYDITNNLQFLYQKYNVKKDNSKHFSLYLKDKKSFNDYKLANQDYFFNKSMIDILKTNINLNQWIPLLICGNINISKINEMNLILIRRRNCKNLNKFCGVQGIVTNSDKTKHLNNFIENEIIIVDKHTHSKKDEDGWTVKSFVYLTSSLPISFSINFKSNSLTINKDIDTIKNDLLDYYQSSQYRNNLLINLSSNYNYNDQMLNQQLDYIIKQIENDEVPEKIQNSNGKKELFNEIFKYQYLGLINNINDDNKDESLDFTDNFYKTFEKISNKLTNHVKFEIELKDVLEYFDFFEFNTEYDLLVKTQQGYFNLSLVNYNETFVYFNFLLVKFFFQLESKNSSGKTKSDYDNEVDKKDIDSIITDLLFSTFYRINFQFNCNNNSNILILNKKEVDDSINNMKIQSGILKLLTREHIMSSSIDYLNKLNEIIFANNHRYRDETIIKSYVVTFNIGAAKEYNENDIRSMFLKIDFSKNSNLPEMIILGFQEIVKLSAMNILIKSSSKKVDQLKKSVEKIINVNDCYKEVHTSELVGLCLLVYCKKECIEKIKNIDSQIIKLGLGGLLGNKGALAIRFDYCQTSIALMCCHLEAGPNKNNHRVKQIKEILNTHMIVAKEEIEKLKNEKSIKVDEVLKNENFIKLRTFTMKNKKSILSNRSSIISLDDCLDTENFSLKLKDHDVVILFGDLNFRVDLKFDESIKILNEEKLSELLRYDQYFKNGVINDMIEGEIKFPPSYKFKTDDEKDQDESDSPYSKHKNRTPSWCDRILFKQNYLIKNQIEVIDYNYIPEVKLSDHKPVYTIFSIRVFSENKDKRKSFEDICSNKLKYLIDDEEMQNSVVSDDNEVKMLYKILQNHNNSSVNTNPRISKCSIDDNYNTIQNIPINKLLGKLQSELLTFSTETYESDLENENKFRSFSTIK